MSDKLEQKVAKTLAANGGAKSAADIAALLTELEQAIVTADEAAKAAHERALDPLQSPDAAAGLRFKEQTAFRASRLRTLLPKLQQRYTVVLAHEEAAAARKRSEPLIVERNRLADELKSLLPTIGQLADCFVKIAANNAALGRYHASLPAHVGLFIRGAEERARGIDRFTRDSPSILKDAILPGLDGKMLWPPPRSEADVTMFAPPTFDPRHSPEWGLHRDQQNAEAEAKAAEAEKEREQAVEAFARERNMPMWWKGEKR
jgi:hypothetical protein